MDNRLGGILNLTWEKVDFKTGMIRLKAEDTKTREARLVPLGPELTASLCTLYKVRALHEPHVFLMKGKSVGSLKTAFNQRVEGQGLQGSLSRLPAHGLTT